MPGSAVTAVSWLAAISETNLLKLDFISASRGSMVVPQEATDLHRYP